ncbi:MAG: asparagine--tRNA ligase, partial [Clostridia bacterium]|nr:asparagine--tRNA ligase [Clostridia bacterium]
MKRTFIKDLFDAMPEAGAEIAVCGWIKTIRNDKFIELSDGTCFNKLQVVAERENLANYDDVVHQNVGAAVRVKGKFVPTPEAKQPFELLATEITVEGTSTPDFPIQKKAASLEFLREQAYLRPRTNTFNAVFRIRSVLGQAIHRYFADHNFIYVHTPIVTASDCEGAGEMFQITTLDMAAPPMTESGEIDYSKDFFGKKANLTVSGQLNVETFCMAFSNVYTFGPTFRAETSN